MSKLNETKRELNKILKPIHQYCNSQNYTNEQTLNVIIEAVANWHIGKQDEPKQLTNEQGLF